MARKKTRREEPTSARKNRERVAGARQAGRAEPEAVLRATPEMVFRVARDGTFLDFVPAEGNPPSLPPGEFLGRKLRDVMPAGFGEQAIGAVERALRTGEVQLLEYRLPVPLEGGEVRDFEARITPLAGDEVLALVSDVTERKRAEEALRESEERLRTTLDGMLEGCQIISRDYRYLYVNDALAGHGRRTREELLGHTMIEMYPDIEDTEMFGHIRRCMDERVSHRMENEFIFPDGEKGWFELSIEPVPEGVLVLSIEITERKRAEEALRRTERALRVSNQCSQAIVVATDEPALLRETRRIIVEEGGYRLAWIGLAEQDEAKTVRPAAHAGYEEGYLETVSITWGDTERGRGPTGRAIRESLPSLARNIPTEPHYEPWRADAMKRGYASSAAFPLVSGAQVLGALNVYAPEPDAFDSEEVRLLEGLAGCLAYGVTSLRMGAERHLVQEALEQERERAQHYLDVAEVMLVAINDKEQVTLVNRKGASVLGYEEGEILGKNWFTNFLPERLREEVRSVNRRLLAGELEPLEYFENLVWTRSGEERLIAWHNALLRDEEGNIVGTLSSGEDITERKQAQEALQEVLETSRDVILKRNLQTNTFDYVSPAALHTSGFTVEELLAMGPEGFDERIHPDDRPAFQAHTQRLVASTEDDTPPTIVYRWRSKDGQYRWFSSSRAFMRDEDGRPVAIASTARDVTQQKAEEEELQEAREQLEQRVERGLAAARAYGLTFRELMVLHLVAEGKADKEIAAALGIRPMTAQKHVSHILAKMEAGSRTEAAARALRAGLLT